MAAVRSDLPCSQRSTSWTAWVRVTLGMSIPSSARSGSWPDRSYSADESASSSPTDDESSLGAHDDRDVGNRRAKSRGRFDRTSPRLANNHNEGRSLVEPILGALP